MPSDKNPAQIVNPGPGRLSAGVATDAAFIFSGSSGGGSAAALHAHIVDPVDAHMASAIGVNPYDLTTGRPILHSVGGVVDGESVMDFITAAKDLWPDPPDSLGWDYVTIPNSGRPVWDTLDMVGTGTGTTVAGAFARGTNVVLTNHIVGATTPNPNLYGMVYPADRGVLAFYHSPNGNYADPGATLVAALWLGSDTPPAGIPTGNFLEGSRHTQQIDYPASGVGLDRISLTARVPCLKDYSTLFVSWLPFDYNFLRYQIARYFLATPLVVSSHDVGSWIWVHWRESYATSLAAIQPSVLATQLTTTNAYSAVPDPDFDTGACFYTNRHNVFRDMNSAVAPHLAAASVDVTPGFPSPTYVHLSGVAHYNGSNLRFDFASVQIGNLANYSFYTELSAAIPSANFPFTIDFSDFGASDWDFAYWSLRKFGTSVNYSPTNAPQWSDVAEFVGSGINPGYSTSHTPVGGQARIRFHLRKPFQHVSTFDPNRIYMFNSYNQVGSTLSTATFEHFVDEKYRYTSTVTPVLTTLTIVPAPGPDNFDSVTSFTAGGPDLQVVGGNLLYPQTDYSTAVFRPVGLPNYAAVLAADPANHLRRYLRAFNTGSPRTTGRLRIRGLPFAAFESSVPYTGVEAADHPGGAIIQVRVPGSTEWLDVGRVKGDPDLALTDFRGCRIGLEISGSDVIVTYDTSLPTVNNGSGEFPIFVRVTFVKGPGTGLSIDELEWLAP